MSFSFNFCSSKMEITHARLYEVLVELLLKPEGFLLAVSSPTSLLVVLSKSSSTSPLSCFLVPLTGSCPSSFHLWSSSFSLLFLPPLCIVLPLGLCPSPSFFLTCLFPPVGFGFSKCMFFIISESNSTRIVPCQGMSNPVCAPRVCWWI